MEDFFLYTRYSITTRLPADKITQRLAEHVKTRSWLAVFLSGISNAKSYSGKIKGSTFRLKRITDYKRKCVPVVSGRLHAANDKTVVHIVIRPPWLVSILLLLFSGFLLWSFYFLISNFNEFQQGYNMMLGVLTILLIIGIFPLLLTGYKEEKRTVMLFLSTMLENSSETDTDGDTVSGNN